MSDHQIELEITVDGADISATVCYDYHPYERMTNDYPGHPETVDVYSVMDGNVEIFGALTEAEIDRIEQQVIDALHDNDEDGA